MYFPKDYLESHYKPEVSDLYKGMSRDRLELSDSLMNIRLLYGPSLSLPTRLVCR